MCQVQLKRTDFRSLAPGVGVNGPASNAPRPRPPPGGPPAPGGPCGGTGPLGACAPAGTDAVTKTARNTPAARAVRNAIAIPPPPLVDRDLELFVALLDGPDESGRVPVLGWEDLDLEQLTGLHRGLVDPLPRQVLHGGCRQDPVRRRPVRVRDGELDA